MTSHDQAILLHHDGFARYDFGPHHPLRPERLDTGLSLLRDAGIYTPDVDTPAVEVASVDEIATVHDIEYIRAIESAGRNEDEPASAVTFGLHSSDNPPFPDIHEASALVTGGTVLGARMILRGDVKHAFNPAGGLHHAQRRRASGFCIYNDPAVAAAIMVREFGSRVFYVDFDCHHGDGVQWIFYDDPRVFTLSFHESGRYLFPGTGEPDEVGEGAGEGTSSNVSFAPFTENNSWQEAVQAILPPLIERFRPDILITNHGCDTHHWDPITHLSLTTQSFAWQARLVHELAHSHTNGRWLAVGSGGYDWLRVVPRSWALLWSEMTGRELPEAVPPSWIERWQNSSRAPLPERFLDDEETMRELPRRADVEEMNRVALDRALRYAHLR